MIILVPWVALRADQVLDASVEVYMKPLPAVQIIVRLTAKIKGYVG